ncbi:MAG TPA: arginase, partial [Thermofilum sp.]|nr:arginase [Thermofilum sp.]
MVPKLLVHGGAGRYRKVSEERRQRVLREIANALDSGVSALRSGSAIEGVVEAI